MNLQNEFECNGNWLFAHRGWLPVIVLAPAILIFWLQQTQTASVAQPWYKYYVTGCLAVGLMGLAVRVYAVGYSHAHTSGRNTRQGQIAESLNTTGIYSTVRHPLYLGNFLMWLSIAMLIGNYWFLIVFVLLFWLYYERIMFAEEQFLERKFGEQFTSWTNRTPAFIPNPARYTKPDGLFSWRKVLRAEKNGLFNLFLVFFAFDFIRATVRGGHRYNGVVLVGFAASTVLYIVLKYLKYKTKVLDD